MLRIKHRDKENGQIHKSTVKQLDPSKFFQALT